MPPWPPGLGDIDSAGIVYYPRFLHYFHVALEEFFSCELGIEYAQVMRKDLEAYHNRCEDKP